ncbi:DUF6207 family protein [Streptomyces massasporeus]
MRPINEAHATEPGLAVVEVAAHDDRTALAVQKLLATLCAIAPADRTTREPGEPGVRLRCFLDLRQAPDTGAGEADRAGTMTVAPTRAASLADARGEGHGPAVSHASANFFHICGPRGSRLELCAGDPRVVPLPRTCQFDQHPGIPRHAALAAFRLYEDSNLKSRHTAGRAGFLYARALGCGPRMSRASRRHCGGDVVF